MQTQGSRWTDRCLDDFLEMFETNVSLIKVINHHTPTKKDIQRHPKGHPTKKDIQLVNSRPKD